AAGIESEIVSESKACANRPASSPGFLKLIHRFSAGDPRGNPLLTGHAITGPRHRIQTLRRNRLIALQANPVTVLIDAAEGGGDLAQQLHVDGVAIEENPLFMMLLAEVALVRRNIQPGYNLRGLLRGHAAAHFFRLLLENPFVAGCPRLQ